MRKIRNFLCFFIYSFHLNCPTTEEQITDRQVLLGVTQKVSSNSKHTLLCLYGHNILVRINLIPLETRSPSGWRRKASKERLIPFLSLLPFTQNAVLKVHLIIFTFLFGAKLNYESCIMAKPKLMQNGKYEPPPLKMLIRAFLRGNDLKAFLLL